MKVIELKINDKDYRLCLNRESVLWLESSGFQIMNIDTKPVTTRELLWTSLFIPNHKDVNPSLALKLMDTYTKQEGEDGPDMVNQVVRFAVDEYLAFINALTGTNSTKNEKKIKIVEQ